MDYTRILLVYVLALSILTVMAKIKITVSDGRASGKMQNGNMVRVRG